MMMPMSVSCQTCGNYIYRGTKFNSKKETVEGEDYFGVLIFRFYMRCNNCSAQFTIKTDPKTAGYVTENNCSRQLEPWREAEDQREALIEERVREEQGDVMKELENKQLDSKMEMDILDALDEIKALNARQARVSVDDVLAQRQGEDEKLAAEDEDAVVRAFEGGVKRIVDDDEEPELDLASLGTRRKKPKPEAPQPAAESKAAPPVVVKKPASKLKLVHY